MFKTMDFKTNEATVGACTEIIGEMANCIKNGKEPDLITIRNKVSSKLKLKSQPKLVEIISAVPESLRKLLLPYLRAKPVRTASGVAVVAVMCKPHRCPHIALLQVTSVFIAQVALIQILSILPKLIQATSLQVCVL